MLSSDFQKCLGCYQEDANPLILRCGHILCLNCASQREMLSEESEECVKCVQCGELSISAQLRFFKDSMKSPQFIGKQQQQQQPRQPQFCKSSLSQSSQNLRQSGRGQLRDTLDTMLSGSEFHQQQQQYQLQQQLQQSQQLHNGNSCITPEKLTEKILDMSPKQHSDMVLFGRRHNNRLSEHADINLSKSQLKRSLTSEKLSQQHIIQGGQGNHFEQQFLQQPGLYGESASNQSQQLQNSSHIRLSSSVQSKPAGILTAEATSSLAICQEHNEPYSLFCEKDNKICCMNCVYGGAAGHKNHKVIPLKQSNVLMLDDLDDFKGKTKDILHRIEQSIRQRQTLKTELLKGLVSNKEQVHVEFQKILQLVLQRQAEMFQELGNSYSIKLKECEQNVTELKELREEMKIFRELESNARKHGGVENVVKAFSQKQSKLAKPIKEIQNILNCSENNTSTTLSSLACQLDFSNRQALIQELASFPRIKLQQSKNSLMNKSTTSVCKPTSKSLNRTSLSSNSSAFIQQTQNRDESGDSKLLKQSNNNTCKEILPKNIPKDSRKVSTNSKLFLNQDKFNQLPNNSVSGQLISPSPSGQLSNNAPTFDFFDSLSTVTAQQTQQTLGQSQQSQMGEGILGNEESSANTSPMITLEGGEYQDSQIQVQLGKKPPLMRQKLNQVTDRNIENKENPGSQKQSHQMYQLSKSNSIPKNLLASAQEVNKENEVFYETTERIHKNFPKMADNSMRYSKQDMSISDNIQKNQSNSSFIAALAERRENILLQSRDKIKLNRSTVHDGSFDKLDSKNLIAEKYPQQPFKKVTSSQSQQNTEILNAVKKDFKMQENIETQIPSSLSNSAMKSDVFSFKPLGLSASKQNSSHVTSTENVFQQGQLKLQTQQNNLQEVLQTVPESGLSQQDDDNQVNLFENSQILQGAMKSKLLSILPFKVQNSSMLLSSFNDTISSEQMHRLCDGRGPYICLVRVDENIFGYFCPISFVRSAKQQSCSSIFLFSLNNIYNTQPFLLPINQQNKHLALFQNTLSPSLGNLPNLSPDLYINFDDLSASFSSVGQTYQLDNRLDGTKVLAGSQTNWNVLGLEIYHISPLLQL